MTLCYAGFVVTMRCARLGDSAAKDNCTTFSLSSVRMMEIGFVTPPSPDAPSGLVAPPERQALINRKER